MMHMHQSSINLGHHHHCHVHCYCNVCGMCLHCGARSWVLPIQPVQPIWIQPPPVYVAPYRVHVNQTINKLAGAHA